MEEQQEVINIRVRIYKIVKYLFWLDTQVNQMSATQYNKLWLAAIFKKAELRKKLNRLTIETHEAVTISETDS